MLYKQLFLLTTFSRERRHIDLLITTRMIFRFSLNFVILQRHKFLFLLIDKHLLTKQKNLLWKLIVPIDYIYQINIINIFKKGGYFTLLELKVLLRNIRKVFVLLRTIEAYLAKHIWTHTITLLFNQ